MNATVIPVDNKCYHADATRIGSTMLMQALECPQLYYEYFVSRERQHEPTDDMILGSCVHALVLEPDTFDSLYACRPAGIDGRTKDGRVALKEFQASCIGKTVITAETRDKAHAMAKSVLAEPTLKSLLGEAKQIHIERAIGWEEGDLKFKCKPDWFLELTGEYDAHLDLKTTTDPTPEYWLSMSSFSPMFVRRYDLSVAAHYPMGIEALTGRPCASGVVCVGKSEPHAVYIHWTTAYRNVGEAWRQKAINIVRRCQESGVWRDELQDEVNIPKRAIPAWAYPE